MSRSHDVVILHVNDAEQWCVYLSSLFKKNKSIKIKPMNMDDQDYENPPELLQAMKETFLVLIIASPDMIDFMKDKTWLSTALDNLPGKTSVVAALCFVNEKKFHADLEPSYRGCSSWKKYVLTEDQKECIETVADMLDIIDKSEPALPPRPGPRQTKKSKLTRIKIRVIPLKVHEPREHVILAFGTEKKGTIQVSFDDDSTKIDTSNLNPYTRKFIAPEKNPGRYILHVYHDAKEIHQTPFVYKAPHEKAFTSLEYLCQSFQCKDHAALDHHLVDILERSIPGDDSLRDLVDKQKDNQTGPLKGKSEYPTLLHFAAASGLSEFTSLLLDIPGSQTAFQIDNIDGKDPAELADLNNHPELAQYIRDFMETSCVADLYMAMTQSGSYKNVESQEPVTESYYMEMDGQGRLVFGDEPEEPYMTAGGLVERREEAPPPPRPQRPKQLPPVPKTAKIRRNTDAAPPSYQAPPPPAQLSRVQSARLPSGPTPATIPRKGNTLPAGLSPSLMDMMESDTERLPMTAMGSNSQSELLDIMDGVKAGKFGSNEALMLFNAWKERNKDGQQSKSFKERQKTLKKMRDEYSEMIYNMEKTAGRTKQSFLSRLISKRQKPSKHVPEITDPISHRKTKGTRNVPSHLVPDDPRHSTSSSSSRESSSSLNIEQDGSSDDSDSGHSDAPVQYRSRKISSTSSYEGEKRHSRKQDFLAEAEMMEELPPLPPRTYTRSDLPRPSPKPRPMQPPRR